MIMFTGESLVNSVLEDALWYIVEYNCSAEQAIDDMDFHVPDQVREEVLEACQYILPTLEDSIRVCAQCGSEDAHEMRDAEVTFCPDCRSVEGGYEYRKEYK